MCRLWNKAPEDADLVRMALMQWVVGFPLRSVDGSDGLKGDFGPHGSRDPTSLRLLRLVGEAALVTLPCEYRLPHLLCCCAGELPIGGAEDECWCAYGDGSQACGEDSLA